VAKLTRRTYSSLTELWADVRAIVSRRRQIGPLMRGERIDPAFRERLMLAVTGVNACRYCSYVHAREALAAGVPEDEIQSLGQGAVENSPPEEVPALLYAQHWAEADGRPDRAAREHVVRTYGERATEEIELALRMIRTANLLGNTFDHVLYRVSFWRRDVERPARRGRRVLR
jgi:AhpD family alkylhydroperoxidase